MSLPALLLESVKPCPLTNRTSASSLDIYYGIIRCFSINYKGIPQFLESAVEL